MQKNDSNDVDRKINLVVNLLAYQIVEGKTLSEAVTILHRLGMRNSEIATLFGTTAKSVSVRQAEANRKLKKTKRN